MEEEEERIENWVETGCNGDGGGGVRKDCNDGGGKWVREGEPDTLEDVT